MHRLGGSGRPGAAGRRVRRVVAAALAPVLAAGISAVPVVFTVSAAVAVSAVSAAVSAPAARASTGSVLILSTSVSGGSSSPEAAAAPSGFTVTVASASTWDAMSTAQFEAFSAIIIGDPSTGGTCSSSVVSAALSDASTWGPAISGNVAVLGTAPGLAGSAGTSLISHAVSYAVSGTGTGLYVSLNCDYATAAAGTPVPLLAQVDGGGFAVTGRGSACPDAGPVNTWQADALPAFQGLGGTSWPSPACSAQETFTAWPAALSGVAYLKGASPASFTASDGQTGQPSVLAGHPASAGTQALAPAAGGEIPEATAVGGTNPAAPGVQQATAGDPVDTENGDFTQSGADVTVPGFGPALDFSRAYDAIRAQQQTQAGTPGPMGYGWTDSLASSLTTSQPTPDDIYALDGLATDDTGNRGPAAGGFMNEPFGDVWNSGNLYIADTGENRVLEVAGSTGTQWGIAMTAGHIYTIAGSDAGTPGISANGTPAGGSLLNGPSTVSLDGSGNLYIADTLNNRVLEVPVAGGTQRTIPMTADDVYTIAGSSGGTAGTSGDGGAATAARLSSPVQVVTDGTGDNPALEISDGGNNRIQYLFESGGTDWAGASFTANDIYTIAGLAAGTSGSSGDKGAATSAKLNVPETVCRSSAGDLYIADLGNSKMRELAKSNANEWGQSMTGGDIYTVVGSGTQGSAANGTAAATAELAGPEGISCAGSTNLYISDTEDGEVQEVPSAAGTQWGISMAADKIYTIAGSNAGASGFGGDGGAAVSAELNQPATVTFDSAGNLYITDSFSNRIREVSVSTDDISTFAGSGGTLFEDGDGGPSTTAGLLNPGVAFDASGDLFIADGASRIQEIAAHSHTQYGIAMTAGDVYTVAGNAAGNAGDTGDGGLATAATLSEDAAIAVDAAGNLYIADTDNGVIRKVSASTGDITRFAGTNGDVGDAGTGDGGPAASATLDQPQGIAVDAAGNVYISDSGAVREVPAAGGVQWGQSMTAGDIYTVAGNEGGAIGNMGDGGPATGALLSEPVTVTLDPAGDLLIGDTQNSQVREVAASSGIQYGQQMSAGDIYTIAGSTAGNFGATGNGGPADSALLDGVLGLAVDHFGDVYIADQQSEQVREITATTVTPFPLAPQANAINITQPDGSVVTFYPQSGGSCAAPYVTAGGFCTLPQNVGATLAFSASGGGTYTYSPTPGTTDVYGSSGALQSESDAAGNTLTIAYGTPAPGSGTCPAAAAACNTVTAASGRTLVVGLNAANLVTSVTDPMDRTWSYAYNSADDLTSATDPLGHVTSYTYGPGSAGNQVQANDLLTITSPNAQPGGPDAGDATANVYNAFGQVTFQIDPMGFTTTFSYCASAAAGNCLNSQTGTVTITDPDGNTTVDDYQQGALAAESLLTGGTLTSETDTIPDAAAGGTSGGTLLAGTTADGDGNITSDTYNAAGDVTSATAPDGVGSQTATTTQGSTSLNQASCDSANEAGSTCPASAGPAPVAPGGVITPPSSAPPQGVAWTLYDTDGNQLYTTTGVYQPGATTASYSQTAYQLFQGNSVTLNTTSITCATAPPAKSLPCATINADGVVTQLAYDFGGDLISSATPDGNGSQIATTSFGYDADGEQTSTIAPDGNLPGANAGNYTTVTAYNADGKKVTVTQAGGTGATATPRTTAYGYDADSNQTSAQDARGFTTATAYNAADEATLVTDPLGNATLTCYDSAGHITQTVPPVGVAAGPLSAASCPSSYPSGYGHRLAADATTYTFDAAGDRTAMSTPAPAGQTGSETTTFTYDGNGSVLTTAAPPASNGSGAPAQVITDTYNSAGKLATETGGSGTSAASTTSYCYDPNGDQTAVVAPDGNTAGTASCETSSPWAISSSAFPAQSAHQTVSTYDSAQELGSTTSPATTAAPSGATTGYTYDPAGNALTSIDPNGITTTWSYTPTDLRASASYSGSSAHSITYAYDADGQQVGMVDATGSPTDSYDPFGELTSVTNGAGQTTGYSYDPTGTRPLLLIRSRRQPAGPRRTR